MLSKMITIAIRMNTRGLSISEIDYSWFSAMNFQIGMIHILMLQNVRRLHTNISACYDQLIP